MTNPAPPKILKEEKFCSDFVGQQNCNKIRKVPKGNEQNYFFPVSVYKYYNPAKRKFCSVVVNFFIF